MWIVLLVLGCAVGAAHASTLERMQAGGVVLMLRHANAPGIGDPDEFRLGDCRTQRNLDGAGRRQARDIGDWLRARGITRARVYSSQWCRCLETAELLDMGPVTPLPALNSFFEMPEHREPNLAALRDFLADQPADGPLLILVTHQVTITAVTGDYVASGHGVLLARDRQAAWGRTGTVDFTD